MKGYLAAIVIIGFFVVLIGVGMNEVTFNDGNQAVLVLVGALAAAFGQIVSWYFGSSEGSARKTEMLGEQKSVTMNATDAAFVKAQQGSARVFMLIALALGTSILFACATGKNGETIVPSNTTEQIYVAQWSITGAANAVADIKPLLSKSDYDNAADILKKSNVALKCAKTAQGIPVTIPGEWSPADCPALAVPDTPADYLILINKLLLQAAAYYRSKGE